MKLTKKNIKTIVENVILLETLSDDEAVEVLEDELEVKEGVVDTVEFLNSDQGSDPKVRDFLDKAPKPDIVEVSDATTTCTGFKPTQKEISLAKSVGWPLSKWSSCEAIPSGDPTGGHGNEPNEDGEIPPNRVVVAGDLVIDGHHRWSQCWAIGGKDNPLEITNLDLPGANAGEKLAVAQVGIVATMDSDGPVPSEDKPIPDNVLGSKFTEDVITQMIMDRVGEQMDSGQPMMGDDWCEDAKSSELGKKLFGISPNDENDVVRETVAEKVASNLATLPDFDSTAPSRDKMPQFSMETDPDDVFKNFADGKVNFRDPFDESIDVKRWNKLAGLLKD